MIPTKNPPPPVKHLGGNGHGNGNGKGQADAGGPPAAPERPARRNSIYPFLVDLGVVLALFGLIIVRTVFSEAAGNIAIGVGAVIAVLALVGWVREARAEYSQMQD